MIPIRDGPPHAISERDNPSQGNRWANCTAYLFPRKLLYRVDCSMLWKAHKSGKSSGVIPSERGDLVWEKDWGTGWLIYGSAPEANPWFTEVFLGCGIGCGDAWGPTLREPDILKARFGRDSVWLHHGGDGLWTDCKQVLRVRVNVMQTQDIPVLNGSRGDS